MANYNNLLSTINGAIRTNGTGAITGQLLQTILDGMVASLGAKYQFAGVATPSTNPGTPDENVFYLATQAGTYTNFGGLVVNDGEVCALEWDGTWTKDITGAATAEQVSQLGQEVATIPIVSVSQNTLTIGGEEKGELAGQLIENSEWVKVVTDNDGKILYGVKTDGKFYFGAGCPPQVQEYVQSQIDAIGIDALLATKVDKVAGKSLIDADYASSQKAVENPEYLEVKTDSNDKVIEAITTEGKKQVNIPIELPSVDIDHINNQEWIEVKTDLGGRIIQGIRKDGSTYLAKVETSQSEEFLDDVVHDLTVDTHLKDASSLVVVTPTMSKTQFIANINSRFRNEYATLCHCNPECFDLLQDTFTESKIYDMINNNFRKDVCLVGMSKSTICARINKAFTETIYRFCDAKPWDNDNNPRYFGYSIQVFPEDDNHQDEPSAIVSEDGSKLYLYAHMKRYESVDGINFTNETELEYQRTSYGYVQHVNVNYINGVYYLIGVTQDGAGVMNFYTSTDGVNFTYKGSLFYPRGTQGPFDIMGDGSIMASAYGNTSLVYANGTWYLYYEWSNNDSGKWEFGLATCTDILHDNGDGTVGNWNPSEVNPICPGVGIRNGEEWFYSCGNPDFAKGMTNQIIKSNGKYYMYFHGAYGGTGSGGLHNYAAMYRAYSEDLVHWTIEDGLCFDNRDISDSDRPVGGNSDQCVIEFKGRTFFYYTHNINNSDLYAPHIRVLIDDRRFEEILKLKP